MDTSGFRDFLQKRNFTPEQVDAFVVFAERFASCCEGAAARSPVDEFWQFSKRMIEESTNTRDNYYAIALCGEFLRDNSLLLAALELVDGSAVLDNLYRKTGEVLGQARRDQIFEGVPLVPVGTPNAEKPATMQPLIQRLEAAEPEACRAILASGLRDLPEEDYAGDRALFESSADLDDYLGRKKQALLAELRKVQQEGRLYFNQEITDQVLEYVERDPEIGQGVRVGDIIYETKIPYQAKEYLAENDPDRKRYYYCHCPWAKESLRDGRSDMPPVFCQCSAAYMGRPWEVIFGEKLQVDVLESVLKGDLHCRFAIHLPARAIQHA
jgi:hypothetical protein